MKEKSANFTLYSLRESLKEMSRKEAIYLWRIARRALKHGCSQKLVEDIREEAFWCHDTGTAYPDRLICYKTSQQFKYAFKMH